MQFREFSIWRSATVFFVAASLGVYFSACSQSVSSDEDDDEVSMASSSSKAETKDSLNSKKFDDSKSSSSKKSGTSSSSVEEDDFVDEECVGEAGNPWDGTTAKKFACGAGTKRSPYMIFTAEQLAHLSFVVADGNEKYIDKYYKLGADILLNKGDIIDDDGALVADSAKLHKWTPIGNSGKSFAGTFDGDGHTVSGMFVNTTTDYNGLFGNVSGVVQNLAVANSWVNGGKYTAGVVGYNVGTLSDLKNSATVSATDECVGGVVGISGQKEYKYNSVINSSKNTGIIVGVEGVGGVVGCVSYVTIDGLTNDADIEGAAYVGGSIGSIGAFKNDIRNLKNSGNITGTAFVGGVSGRCGGLPQYYTNKKATYSCLENSYACGSLKNAENEGSVHGRDYVGGVLGMVCNGELSVLGNMADVKGEYGVGGVVGSIVYSTTESMYNTGDVAGENFVGGVFSYHKEGVTSSAYSTGKVDGDSLVGLVIGYNYNSTLADYYYLEQDDQEPFGENDGGGVATPKTEKEMKSKKFAELLGEDFTYDSDDNDGWPMLEWVGE